MTALPKRYDHKIVEEKWQKAWEEWGIYKFDPTDREKPTYSIDTPPPYPSGEFHVGNALNHAYIDFSARYKRLRGYNVLFPQGWDCHGLPTEVRVEKTIGKSKSEMSPEEFTKLCVKYTNEWIEDMKKAIKGLGCSIDWSREYKTMDPDYWRRVQYSFVEMYKKGMVYRSEHPVYWCPRCETALAEAEIDYREEEKSLYYYTFRVVGGEPIPVASTRPELLAACVAVAVNPRDERYSRYVGGEAVVPIYERKVPIIADEEVDIEFGTGVVMVCTYGDKTDVRWQSKHGLPIIKAIDEKGRMTSIAGRELEGLKVEDARRKIVELLKSKGLLFKVEKTLSSVGTCWRCKTPVEIIPKMQWFVKTRAIASKIIEEADRIKWVPPHAKKRLIDWVNSLDWDWVISRQRVFATPIPVWYCERGHVIVAEPEWLPIDPRKDNPPIDKCPKCGGDLTPETDVMDTWMDSSITAAVHAGYPEKIDERIFPADLQPNGYDIIRTWDYYLMARGIILFGKTQFKIALINGMVRGTDGRMMHKSYGNYVSLLEVLDKYGADAFRVWVATSASTGSDVRFRWEGLEFARRFLVKLWNAARMASIFLGDYNPKRSGEVKLRPVDYWILGELNNAIEKATSAMDEYEWIDAASTLVEFTWRKLCDHYLEAIKYRMRASGESLRAAQYTLYRVLLKTIIMLSVFTPHLTEEIYQNLYAKYEKWKSVTVAEWPSLEDVREEEYFRGGVIIETIAEIRRAKHEMRIALNAPLKNVKIQPGKYREAIVEGLDDISGTLRVGNIELVEELSEGISVGRFPEIKFKIEP